MRPSALLLDDASSQSGTLLTRQSRDAGHSEKWLQDIVFQHPEILPLNEISDSVHGFVPICSELLVPKEGRYMTVAEAMVYRSLECLCHEYSGGYWKFYELTNGGFYMAPVTGQRMRIQCAGNGFDGEMSADAAGIVACLMAFNALVWKTRDEHFEHLFYCLREFASDHPESCAISAAID